MCQLRVNDAMCQLQCDQMYVSVAICQLRVKDAVTQIPQVKTHQQQFPIVATPDQTKDGNMALDLCTHWVLLSTCRDQQ